MINVAILLATFNGAKYLDDQLRSIANQKKVCIKIFLSDHSSSDHTISIFKKACLKYHISYNIITDEVPYKGAGQNFFHLIRNVFPNNFDFFAFADQDDIWFPLKLFYAIDKMRKNNADSYSSSVFSFNTNYCKHYINKFPGQKKYDYFFQSPGPGCSFVISHRLFCNLRNFIILKKRIMQNVYYHDWFIYAYARHFDYKWFIDSDSYIMYRQHDHNDTGANISYINKLKRILLLWNNWAFNQAYIISEIIGYKKKLYIFYKSYPFNLLKLIFTIYQYRRDSFSSFILFIAAVFKRFRPI